jgi:hypothetical protein
MNTHQHPLNPPMLRPYPCGVSMKHIEDIRLID